MSTAATTQKCARYSILSSVIREMTTESYFNCVVNQIIHQPINQSFDLFIKLKFNTNFTCMLVSNNTMNKPICAYQKPISLSKHVIAACATASHRWVTLKSRPIMRSSKQMFISCIVYECIVMRPSYILVQLHTINLCSIWVTRFGMR